MAMIGTGGRGTSLLGNLLAADAQVVALCDIVPEKAEHAASLVVAAGQKKPALYTHGPHDFRKLVAEAMWTGAGGHAVELARGDGAGRHEARQGCGH